MIIGRLNTVEEKLVEVGRNGLFFKSHAVLGKPATCPPVVIESGSSSFSCDLGPTVSNPTTMYSSSTVSTNIDNNDNDVEEEDSVVGS